MARSRVLRLYRTSDAGSGGPHRCGRRQFGSGRPGGSGGAYSPHYGEYRKLVTAARRDPPDLAILTDSPDFHLRLAARLKAAGIPIVYLVAPQVWAWRRGRLG